MSIQNQALIAILSISQWTARKFDRRTSQEINHAHNTENAGRFNKILVAEKALKDLQKIATAARSFHKENTTPYLYDGLSLLASKNYFHYASKIRDYKNQFEQAAQEIINNYDALKQQAELDLKTLFNPLDYPQNIEQKYNFAVSFSPVPSSSHLILDIEQNTLKELQADIDAQIKTVTETSNKEIYTRIETLTRHAAKTLKQPDKIFRGSLITNIAELADLIPRLYTDTDVTPIINKLREFSAHTPQDLRDKPIIRKMAAEDADQILDTLKSIYGG